MRNATPQGPPPSPGFTLLELMVIIVLIGIMSAMIIPEMKGTYGDALLRSTGRELVSVFSLASSRAVSINQAHRFRLDHSTGKYLIEKRAHDRGREDDFVPAKDILGGEGTLDTRVTVEIHKSDTGSDTERPDTERLDTEPVAATERDLAGGERSEGIVFYPDGTAESAEVLLRDREGFRLGLRINPVTSRVYLIELGRE